MNTICWTDSPRARTQLGRKTWVAAPRVDSTASQAAPAGSSRRTATGRSRTKTMPASAAAKTTLATNIIAPVETLASSRGNATAPATAPTPSAPSRIP